MLVNAKKWLAYSKEKKREIMAQVLTEETARHLEENPDNNRAQDFHMGFLQGIDFLTRMLGQAVKK